MAPIEMLQHSIPTGKFFLGKSGFFIRKSGNDVLHQEKGKVNLTKQWNLDNRRTRIPKNKASEQQTNLFSGVIGASCSTRGSLNCVVFVLWSTKYGLPLGAILSSQPGGRGPSSSEMGMCRGNRGSWKDWAPVSLL